MERRLLLRSTPDELAEYFRHLRKVRDELQAERERAERLCRESEELCRAAQRKVGE